MSQSLNVIALISGGKDSMYSILHCLQNGHKVVALGNLYPLPLESIKSPERQEIEPDEENLNSHMYQTVGHTVIPLYEDALGIPLYRHPIMGKASAMEATYEKPLNGIDETESLIPLLEKIMVAHPEANAVSTGAILSTYQRTRVESIALRLGLVPLSFLWQYLCIFPTSRISLLADMASVGFDARIIKIASWALNDSFLWQNVASEETMQRVEKAMVRFGNDDGAALGEGGEFETLALDGPHHFFKGRILVEEEDRQVIHGSADTAWVRINRARVEMKAFDKKIRNVSVRIPDLFSDDFQNVCRTLELLVEREKYPGENKSKDNHSQLYSTRVTLKSIVEGQKWTLVGLMHPNTRIEKEVAQIVAQIKECLEKRDLCVTKVISTLILLRSMSYFAIVNKIYGSFFSKSNPPARVTIACGEALPPNCNIIVQLSIASDHGERLSTDDLHVQSISYWAPANIGPYSQARSDVIYQSTGNTGLVYLAGQIPLVPSTMALIGAEVRPNVKVNMSANLADACPGWDSCQLSNFIKQATLSLQHLWRIGHSMNICWWTGTVAYLSKDTSSNIFWKARLAAAAWSEANRDQERAHPEGSQEYDEQEPDPWEQRYNKAFIHEQATRTPAQNLPDWSVIKPDLSNPHKSDQLSQVKIPPFFAAEVEELPRDSDIEWHALLGVTRSPIMQTAPPQHATGSAFKHVIAKRFSQIIVTITYTADIEHLARTIEQLLSEIETPREAQRRKTCPGYHHAHTAYLDAGVAGLWDAESSYAGVIPCYSLWGTGTSTGTRTGTETETGVGGASLDRLAAVLVFQSLM